MATATKNIYAEKIQGNLSITSVSATSISATTYYNYPDTFVTGFTLSSNTITLTQNRTDGYSSFTISLSAYTGTSISGLYLPLSGGTVTGDTYFTSGLSANTLYVSGLTQTSGITSTGGVIFPEKTIGSTYTASTNDYMIVISGGSFDITLPTAVGVQGKLYVIKNRGASVVNVIPQIGELIDDRTDVLLSQSNSIQVASDGVNWVLLGYNISSTQSNTGVISFTGLTKASNTTFTVAPVKGFVVDDTTNPVIPFLTYVAFSGGTFTDNYVSTDFETFVYITSGGTISQQSTPLTEKQRRQNIFLGKIGHPDKTSINLVFSQPDYIQSPLSQVRDMFVPINLINGGVLPSANTGLTFNTSAGYIYGLGINFSSDNLSPNAVYVSGRTPCTFQYRTQTGGSVTNVVNIDPSNYDLNGVITPITGTKATNQRIFLLQNGTFRVQYGQKEYNTLTLAIEALQTESFTEFPNFINNAVLIGILTILSTATDITDTSKARFFFASKFGETVGAAGGVATTTLQQAYNNSSNPEILINSTLDGLSIQNGAGTADNITNLIEGKNTAASTTSFIRADGLISGNTLSTVGFTANANGVTATTISAGTYTNLPTYISATTLSSANVLSVTTGGGSPTTSTVNAVTGGTYSNGTITLSGTGSVNGNTITGFSTGGLTWQFATSPLTASTNNGYITTGTTSIALPTVAALGSTIEIVAASDNLFTITQNTNQFIRFGIVTTAPTSGTLVSQNNGDSIRLVCTSANTVFTVVSAVGTITLN